jgi:transposase-like protein
MPFSRDIGLPALFDSSVRQPQSTHRCVKLAGQIWRRSTAILSTVFRKALATSLPRWPRKVTLDGYRPSHQALRLLRREDPKWKYVLVRNNQYLNNIVEQDHRAIKRRCSWMTGFKSDRNAAITISGIELAHRIRKRQFSFGSGTWHRSWSLKKVWDRALA